VSGEAASQPDAGAGPLGAAVGQREARDAEDVQIDQARRAGFVPLVRLLERLTGQPLGSAATPEDEFVRFRHDPGLAFSTGDVRAVRRVELPPRPSDPEGAPRQGFVVTTTFLGLTGGVSPLPNYLLEEVAQEDPDAARVRDFLDVFHHRLLALLSVALRGHDVAGGALAGPAGVAWAERIGALAGLMAGEVQGLGAVPPWRLLRLAPLLAEPCITGEGLAAALEDVLEDELGPARVTVTPFAGGWMDLPEDQIARLGQEGCRLGRALPLGRRVWDPAGGFKVNVGPLGADQYQRLASTDLVARVSGLVRALAGDAIDHEVVLLLEGGAAPGLALGRSRLGRDAWLGGQRRRASLLATSVT
jgi:type VI secretion system protein ImpH